MENYAGFLTLDHFLQELVVGNLNVWLILCILSKPCQRCVLLEYIKSLPDDEALELKLIDIFLRSFFEPNPIYLIFGAMSKEAYRDDARGVISVFLTFATCHSKEKVLMSGYPTKL